MTLPAGSHVGTSESGHNLLRRPFKLDVTRGMRAQQNTEVSKRASGYVRVSTQEQATDGVSLDAQRDRLKDYCKAYENKLIYLNFDKGSFGSTLLRFLEVPQLVGAAGRTWLVPIRKVPNAPQGKLRGLARIRKSPFRSP
jgi:hypothetical protein